MASFAESILKAAAKIQIPVFRAKHLASLTLDAESQDAVIKANPVIKFMNCARPVTESKGARGTEWTFKTPSPKTCRTCHFNKSNSNQEIKCKRIK